ncbi:hypothetical protein [Actinomyces sp. zg328]|uniref:hypothetical protein n=1 Tax=Actinomyces sp. zg328 TaxID=2609287 RepID=UPI001357D554|nr:hypothetical protein [Actinomyces sp. zg328]
MSQYPPNGQYPGQYPGQHPGQPASPASQQPTQAYPWHGQTHPGHPQAGYGSGYQPGLTPSSHIGAQTGPQGSFQPVDPAFGYGGPNQGPHQPQKSTGLIVGIVSAVVIGLIASGVGAFLLLRGDDDAANATATAQGTSAHPESADAATRAKRPSESPAPSSTPGAAAGSQEVTGPATGLTFSVPKNWTTGVGGAPDPGGILTADITSDLDAYAYSGSGLKQVQLHKDVESLSSALSEDLLKAALSQQPGTTFSSYEKFTTPNGDGAMAYFTVNQDGITIYGALITPKTSSGGYATLTTVAFTEAQSKELTQSVIASIR